MIITDFLKTRHDGVNLYETHSDNNVYIQKVGTNEKYISVIDVENSGFSYVETDKKIPEYILNNIQRQKERRSHAEQNN